MADVTCPPNPGPVVIEGTVVVENRRCVLDGTWVKGNVLVKYGGVLIARDAEIEGNIQADGGEFVRIVRTDVGGSIQLENVGGGDSTISRNTVAGSIQLASNSGKMLVQYNAVDEDMQAFSNSGGVVIRYNTIDGNLQCKGNVPRPRGGFNVVAGNKEDQCARL
jgi:hypothetical protein